MQKDIDSLKAALAEDSANIYRFRKIRPYLNYNERHSFDNPVRTSFYGPQIGAVLFEKHIVGAGVYFSGRGTRKPYETFDGGNIVTKQINVTFYTLFYQYILSNRRFVELHLQAEGGTGNFYSAYLDPQGQSYNVRNDPFHQSGAGVQIILKPVRWIGLTATAGYRLANESIFTGYFYSYGVWLGLRHLKNDAIYHLYKKRRYHKEVEKLKKS